MILQISSVKAIPDINMTIIWWYIRMIGSIIRILIFFDATKLANVTVPNLLNVDLCLIYPINKF